MTRYEICYNGRKTAVRPFPISIDFDELSGEAQKEQVKTEIEHLKIKLGLNG